MVLTVVVEDHEAEGAEMTSGYGDQHKRPLTWADLTENWRKLEAQKGSK